MRKIPTKWVYQFTEGELAAIRRRRAEGESVRAIARSFQVSIGVVCRLLKAMEDGTAARWFSEPTAPGAAS